MVLQASDSEYVGDMGNRLGSDTVGQKARTLDFIIRTDLSSNVI
jgi:hypothetical protein